MKDTHALAFRRLSGPDEDGLIRIEVRARNDNFAATGEALTNAEHLRSFAEALSTFPEQIPASTAFSAGCGSCNVELVVETLDAAGHVGVRVSIQELRQHRPGASTFWLKTEPHFLEELARQLREVADLASERAELLA